MNTLGKENYLWKVKNAMLFHFSNREIHTTLEDLNQLFELEKENGKTEEEVYNEFGVPKDFIYDLLQDKRDRFIGNLFRYTAGALLLCVFIILAFSYRSQVLLCILTVLVPGFLWNFLGGGCLLEICTESEKSLKKLYVYYILSFLIISSEQIFITLLNTNLDRMLPFGKAVYNLSALLFVAAVCMLPVAIYRLYRGHCLSFASFILSCGTIGSLFLYLDYLMRFVDAGEAYVSGCLPYMVSVIFSAVYLWSYRLRKTM